jgi:cephalosporin hydroxylase
VSNTDEALKAYHRWYYDNEVWDRTTFLGIPCLKAVTDLWSYQEIITALRPSLVLEFGTYIGGSALYFAEVARLANPSSRIITVDRKVERIAGLVRSHPMIRVVEADTTDPLVSEIVSLVRSESPGPLFAVLDSSHTKAHVLAELQLLRSITISGDYVVVEDTNMNGHPVTTDFGEGPMEAVLAYDEAYPEDYVHDIDRENKFGLTFAPRGFMIRQ